MASNISEAVVITYFEISRTYFALCIWHGASIISSIIQCNFIVFCI